VAKAAKKKAAPKAKAKAKAKAKSKPISLHPMIDKGTFAAAKKNFAGATLTCKCATDPVTVEISSQSAHNHACGCTKCWKPEGAIFAIVSVAPSDKVKVTANGHKLKVVDPDALILRHACTGCGVHMYGPVTRAGHAFEGLSFIHTELSDKKGWSPPGFAAFVSSVIESGTPPSTLSAIRKRLKAVGLEPYDCLNPGLMDYLATVSAKKAGTYRES
jgi:S-(hydroxymethyl)glutathione synthase